MKYSIKSNSIARILCVLAVCFVGMFGFDKQIKHKDFNITLSSPKNFTSGENNFNIYIQKDGTKLKDLTLKVQFMMPEMPGMPKMTEEAIISANGDSYKGVVSFPHGGTWQIRIEFSVDDKQYIAKSSIDF